MLLFNIYVMLVMIYLLIQRINYLFIIPYRVYYEIKTSSFMCEIVKVFEYEYHYHGVVPRSWRELRCSVKKEKKNQI